MWMMKYPLFLLAVVAVFLAAIANAELSPVLTSPQPMAKVLTRVQQLRNRTEQLFSILNGERTAFQSDEEMGIVDKSVSTEVFNEVLRLYQLKLGQERTFEMSDTDDYSESSSLTGPIVFNPCSSDHCVAKFATAYAKVPFDIPCSTASGFIPKDPQLPLIFPGNFELCESYGFVHAHFCTIQTGYLVAPILDPEEKSLFPKPKDFQVLGTMLLGKCVASQCNANLLKRKFLSGVKSTAWQLFFKSFRGRTDYLFLASYIEATTQVNCVQEDTLDQGEEFESMGTMLFIFLAVLLFVFGLGFSIYHSVYAHTRNKYVLSFSWAHNFTALFLPTRGEYAFLNGVRVISMMWVIYGHVALMSTIALNVPISNPTAIDNQLQSFSMSFIRAAEYAVDTFFFMSGLLAAAGIIEATFAGRFQKIGISTYLGLIFVRFIRLTPVYMFVLFFYVKVLPYCGSGPYWLLNNHRKDLEHSCRHFFANLFYFNNLYPFGPDGGIDTCMGWSWYLANDMQFFLLVPWLSWLFVAQWKATQESGNTLLRMIRLYGPCAVLIVIQITVTATIAQRPSIRSTFDENFSAYIYVKPWCRMSPYIVGCWLAMYRFDRQQAILRSQRIDFIDMSSVNPILLQSTSPKAFDWITTAWIRKQLVAALAFGLTLIVSFVLYDDFRCKAKPDSECHVWYAFLSYGAISSGNWTKAGHSAYIALGYPLWGLALALLTNYAANGNGGVITRFLAHPFFTPLARLSYTVYLIHLICMQWFYSRAPAPTYSNPMRQVLDTGAFTLLCFLVALFLHLLVEKPFTSLLPWCIGFDKNERRSQQTRSTVMPLERELSQVGDVDSETVIIGTPRRRSSVDLIEQPLLATTTATTTQ